MIDPEIAGFTGNRIQFAVLREAWALWIAGNASAKAIDAVVEASIGRRLGGLDIMFRFARFLQPTLDMAPMPPDAAGERSQAASSRIRSHPASDFCPRSSSRIPVTASPRLEAWRRRYRTRPRGPSPR